MDIEIIATFDTRRAAELAVEHLVQEHGLDRTDIFIQSDGPGNTAGNVQSGADLQEGAAKRKEGARPTLSGAILVSVGCEDGPRRELVRAALREAGATDVR